MEGLGSKYYHTSVKKDWLDEKKGGSKHLRRPYGIKKKMKMPEELWHINNISTITYTVQLVLVPNERTCSQLHTHAKKK